MRISTCIYLLAAGLVRAASWGFDDATLQVQQVSGDDAPKITLSPTKALTESIPLKPKGQLRLALTITNGGKARSAHQAFVTLSSSESGLEESFPLDINDKGKAKVFIKYSDIPSALLSSKSLQADIVIGSFGSSKPLKATVFALVPVQDRKSYPSSSAPRYSSLPEIHHKFKDDPRSPAKLITLVFTAAVVAAFPILLIFWLASGANLSHLPKAFGTAPISHTLFFSSIVGIEIVFWNYYTHWKLFTVLPVAGVLAVVAFLSGSGALTEVQERRLNGER